MRASIVILVAVVAAFTSSGLASASNPVQLQQSVPGVTNKVENADGGRFLRDGLKDESDDLTSEERGFWGDLAKKAKPYLNGDKMYARLFKKSDKQLKKREITPEQLRDVANHLEKAGLPAAKVREFKRRVEGYDRYYYNLANWKF
ncbi:hypothetical protein DVH05_010080 [Phytophthora capsici]|nr:hypothetical protein DVH05_010080 [Phytophthora capsici]